MISWLSSIKLAFPPACVPALGSRLVAAEASPVIYTASLPHSLRLRVLLLGFLQNGDVGILGLHSPSNSVRLQTWSVRPESIAGVILRLE